MTAPIDQRRPELDFSDSEFLGWAAHSITESTEQLRGSLVSRRASGSNRRGRS
jgi:hypothetical protein